MGSTLTINDVTLTSRWIDILWALDHLGRTTPTRIAVHLDGPKGGRPDAGVRNALLALERRGLVKQNIWQRDWFLDADGQEIIAELKRRRTIQ